jgi:hypothetical protein
MVMTARHRRTGAAVGVAEEEIANTTLDPLSLHFFRILPIESEALLPSGATSCGTTRRA